jgi:hypothetical protein
VETPPSGEETSPPLSRRPAEDSRDGTVKDGNAEHFRYKLVRSGAVLDGHGLPTVEQESKEPNREQQKGWHVSRLFVVIHFEVDRYKRMESRRGTTRRPHEAHPAIRSTVRRLRGHGFDYASDGADAVAVWR